MKPHYFDKIRKKNYFRYSYGRSVGSILGALLEAVKHADMVANGNNIDPTDTTLSIIIGALEGAAKGIGEGAKDGFKEWITWGASGKYDQMKAISELDKTYSQIITLYSEGKYFEATFVGISTLVDIGFGPQLNSLFCFVNDTTVMLETGEISESEAVTAIEQQIETIRSQYGNVVTSIIIFVVAGLLIQSRRNKKQNQDMVYPKNTNITSDNDQKNMNKSISDDTNICQDTNTNKTITSCIENSMMNHNQRERTWSYLVTSGLWIILIGLVLFLWNSYRTPPINNTVAHTAIQPVTYSVPSGVRFAKIQDVQVGERAIGTNPEVTDSERKIFLSDPEPTTWRKLTLEMIKSDGKRLDITLLRPTDWISESKAAIGATINLDLPEMGAQGMAKVLNIEPCPSIKPGRGNVITGTFHHEAANTIDLYVEGLSKPIGTTDNHPFWSVTRQEFIEAGKLQQNEELQLYSGQTAKVIQILPRPGPERVHNLEVMNEHVYRVTLGGVLVHNQCGKIWNSIEATSGLREGTIIPSSFTMDLPNGQKVWVHGNATEHMAEYARGATNRGISPDGVNLISQVQLESFQAAVNAATQNGIPYNTSVLVGGWELKFGEKPSDPTLSIPIVHALMK
ncbi:MAG: HINT domain-containing protein [Planctomycetaceae bacterium]|nr:HINT domain-containing protein [Planctomycetaceae bacterium]